MKEFVTSCNPQNFDIVNHFTEKEVIYWKMERRCNVGDIVYIYVGRPYSRLMYVCNVQEINLKQCPGEYSIYLMGKKDKTYMKMRLREILPVVGFSLKELTDNGLKTVQCTTIVSEELHSYIKKQGCS